MKKLSIFTLAVILVLGLTACGRKNNNEPTTVPTTTAPSTTPTILPTEPMTTNIPDPSVDTSMPSMSDATAGMDTTETTGK